MGSIVRTLVVGLAVGIALGVATALVILWLQPAPQVRGHPTMRALGAYLWGLFAFGIGCVLGMVLDRRSIQPALDRRRARMLEAIAAGRITKL